MTLPVPVLGQTGSRDHALGLLVDELTAKLQAGEPVDLEAYLQGYPQYAEKLRQLLPSLEMLAELGRSAVAAPGQILPVAGAAEELLGTLGDFRLLRELGRGGMGVVYEAVQISLSRRVALKLLPFAAALDPKQLQRFKNEAQAAAHLQHTNIVPVHYVGCERGVHFYAMQYIEGQTLAALIRGLHQLAEPQAPASELAAGLGASWASQLASGRWAPNKRPDREVVGACDDGERTGPYRPRPPKTNQSPTAPPAEITPPVAALSTEPSAKSPGFFRTVAHLGLQAAEALEHAHQLGVIHRDIKPANLLVDAGGRLWITDFGLAHCQSQPGLTMSGDLVGTLRYMSPEQALAKRVTVDARTDVYSLGVTLYELLTLKPAYDGRNREDVLRQIAFEEPRPPRRLNPAVPAELETVVLKGMAKNPDERYVTAQELADDLRRFLEDKPIRAKRPSLQQRAAKWGRRHKTVVRAALVVLALAMVGLAVSTALIWHAKEDLGKALERERQTSYYQRIALAEREWSTNNLRRFEELLDSCAEDLHGWEWLYLKRLRLEAPRPLRHEAAVLSALFSPDGQWIASGSRDGLVTVWHARTGQKQYSFQAHQGGHVRSVAFSPDGRRLATGSWDGTAKVWDFDALRTGDRSPPCLAVLKHRDRVQMVAFSPDGQRLATAGEDRTVRVWDLAMEPPAEIFILSTHTGLIWSVTYSADGQYLASGSDDTTVRIWDARTGEEKRVLRGHSTPVLALAFSRDGKQLASGSGDWANLGAGELKVWDVRKGQETVTLRGHVGWVSGVAFSRDARRLACADGDGNVMLWDLTTAQEALTLRGHRSSIRSVAFSPDGYRLVTASHDKTVRVWDATPLQTEGRQEIFTLDGHVGGVRRVAFSPDSRHLVSAGDDATLRVWDVKLGFVRAAHALLKTLPFQRSMVPNVAFSKDGRALAAGAISTSGNSRTLTVWDTTTWQKSFSIPDGGAPVAFSPDGRFLATGATQVGNAFRIRVLDAASAEEIHTLEGHGWLITALVFSPEPGLAYLASASADGTVWIWDVTTGKKIVDSPLPHEDRVVGLAFSADGRLLASGGENRIVKIWDAHSWKLLEEQPDPTGSIRSLMFHPTDSRLLVWGSSDGTVKLWDRIKREVTTLHGHRDIVEGVAFSPDGEWIASASLDKTIKVWRTPPGADTPVHPTPSRISVPAVDEKTKAK